VRDQKWKNCDTNPREFKEISLNQCKHLDQRKESFLLNLVTVPPPPKKKNFAFFSIDLFIYY
jgi:hypothetical protein